MSELRTLAAFITGFTSGQAPAAVREAAVLRILDAVGVGAGAAGNPQIESVSRAWLQKDGHAEREADVWGQGRTAPVSEAVFLNAMMAHTLELDDVHTGSKTHIGTVVVPAAYGLAQVLGSSGRELVDAVICGGIGPGAQMALAEAGIKLYAGCSGDADQCVTDLLTGTLVYVEAATCDHHRGEEAHACGDHGCGSHDHACGH